jgi:hypothetical protein
MNRLVNAFEIQRDDGAGGDAAGDAVPVRRRCR